MSDDLEIKETRPQRRGIKPFQAGLENLDHAKGKTNEFFVSEDFPVSTLGTMRAELVGEWGGPLTDPQQQGYFIDKNGNLGVADVAKLDSENSGYRMLSISLSSQTINDQNIQKMRPLNCVMWVDEAKIMKSILVYDAQGEFEPTYKFAKEGEGEEAKELYLALDNNLLKKVQVGFEGQQEPTGGDN